jgi:hypothetical protein
VIRGAQIPRAMSLWRLFFLKDGTKYFWVFNMELALCHKSGTWHFEVGFFFGGGGGEGICVSCFYHLFGDIFLNIAIFMWV